MERYLIINADDFGMCWGSVAAVMDLFKNEKSALTSATVMAPCPWAAAACRFAGKNPQFAVGVHLTFTSEWETYRWSPVADNVPSLTDGSGYMWRTGSALEAHADTRQIEQEIRAQIARCAQLGLTAPSHLDNHMGSLYGICTGRFELLRTVLGVAGEYGLPFRLPSSVDKIAWENGTLAIGTEASETGKAAQKMVELARERHVALPHHLLPGDWRGPQSESYEQFREYLYALYAGLPDGVTETYLHPSLPTQELKAITGLWERRVWEYRILQDPKTRQHIEAHGIRMISYRELNKMQ